MELYLEDIEKELFDAGLDYRKGFDKESEFDCITVLAGEQHLTICPLWSSSNGKDEDDFFFDSDDIRARLYRFGQVEEEFDLYPESVGELIDSFIRVFSLGVDGLE